MTFSLRLATVVAVLIVAMGCQATTTPSTGPSLSQTSAVTSSLTAVDSGRPSPSATLAAGPHTALRYVAFGDSWPEGAHCNGCRTFAGLWADGLEALTGRTVEFTDMTGSHERSTAGGKGSLSLLQAVRTDAMTRAAVAAADVILIDTGSNEMEPVVENQIKAGTCGGSDDADCIRALGEEWRKNFDAILTEIDTLRAGRPTVVRLVNAINLFVSVPEVAAGLPGFGLGNGALMFQLLTDANCAAAEAHNAVCIDIRPLLTGPAMDQVADENAASSMRTVADALLATGIDELR